MAIKLDMENSFGRVMHNNLFKVIKSFGFVEKVINWIREFFGNPWIAPLVIGIPTPFLRETRGMHQGFPLSPFLYTLWWNPSIEI